MCARTKDTCFAFRILVSLERRERETEVGHADLNAFVETPYASEALRPIWVKCDRQQLLRRRKLMGHDLQQLFSSIDVGSLEQPNRNLPQIRPQTLFQLFRR